MTQQELATIAEAAQGREGKTTPAPWELFFNQQGRCEGVNGVRRDVIDATGGHLGNTTPDDIELILAAPQLQAALIYATDSITIYLAYIDDLVQHVAAQSARIDELELELYELDLLSHGGL